jgi:hypothetical protein
MDQKQQALYDHEEDDDSGDGHEWRARYMMVASEAAIGQPGKNAAQKSSSKPARKS